MEIKNTLVFGNGFSRTVFENMPSWVSLFENMESAIKNYTILYEVSFLKNGYQDEYDVKQEIMQKIQNMHSIEKIQKNILDLDVFGQYLVEKNINNIITTNYDKGIENILCKKCAYRKVAPERLVEEELYSIRTYKKFVNIENGHQIKLWKIHGDVDRVKSMTLGFDQYCGSLSKLSEYIKGKYKSDKGPECKVAMAEKCRTQKFDNLSWAELFFNTNVYIIGFGMDFSEIDIWWLLNKHMRIKREVSQVRNKIYYLFNNQFDSKDEKVDIFEALEAFQVECRGIDSNENYIRNIFKEIF